MAKVSASVVINKPIQEVFKYTASPVNGPAFIPNLNENTNIQPEQPGLGQTFDWRFNMAGVDLKGKAEVTEYEASHKVTIKTTGDSNTTWIYTFQEESGGTQVSAEVDYEIVESALQKIANRVLIDKLNQRTAEQMLENLKTILEG
ncbi:hypothetical protein A2865_02585 [Candidatus Woesebacteria bacterium RIFCSPHIGHO2_01_FULL_39_17]|uniref:Polyketide cyclase/dehydrase n=3 Tax=Candidatus Woeseibacteriota TaxID=1752722 RepID=A0A0G0RJU9_9BACT|nr:MAG: hypothetical protein US72_C0003G0095 [Microgenomates group bacterium GW2011_GWC1_38_12]KKQ94520.1 MAG: hypothetical protein UT19_C0001G0052 [Candidatus Woesebacteria bacterium GW2011_GWB1_39_10b]KKR13917.1 MAG: hypothetical protein UT40_C0008G0041 [Candidatus Woesebacteria bacterium GW2011_GWA1_39_21b]OGM22478.1 MAG: hypothetical protein A2865_02585 [Candidatus Woesebacteria bacterium RIFCSPHIGHO2_01_FULL_39_17]OGM65539.1 MAG: hypothetical protein A3A52_01520 [Candidatus Woesebacteria b